MPYLLSVDLGTTFSAAAISEDGRVEIIALGSQTATIPSVVALRTDGTVLTGEAAERRGVTEPTRVAREFKRRLGDPTPLVIGGTPYGAETLMAHLLRGIVDRVAEQQAAPPRKVVLSHPANYGPYKLDLLEQVGHLAELAEVEFITEPQAAAVHYSGLERIEAGEAVAVYDLGGGTFDAALVRRTETGFELLGTPDGMERFGGIDLDEAVFEHVRRFLGRALEGLDPTDPAVTSALVRLRKDCRAAKEGLSADTDAAIPVMLPSLHTEVRLTRSEFEDMVRPRLRETMTTLTRVVSSAGLEFSDLSRVLLVGGSSRIPLVSEMVREATGRPVGLGAHPKHAIALGAAAAGEVGATRPTAAAAAVSVPQEEASGMPEEPTITEPWPESATIPAQLKAKPDEPELYPPDPEELEPPLSAAEESEVGAAPPPETPTRRLRIPRVGIAAALVAIVAVILGIVFLGGTDDQAPPSDQTTLQAEPGTTSQSSQPDNGEQPPDDGERSPDDGGPPSDDGEPPPDDGFPPVEGPAPAPNVVVTYTTNLMVPDIRGDWGGWIIEGENAPPEDIASDFYPALGLYDVADPAVVLQHLAWMRQAGIGTVAAIWDGPDSPGAEVMAVLLEFVERYGLSIAVYLPGLERSPQEFLDLAILAKEMYGESPAWLRATGRNRDEPQPILFLGLPEEFPVDVDAWAPVLEEVRSFGLTIVVDSWDPVWIEAGADGLVAGDVDGGYEWANDLPDDAFYVPMVSPGLSAGRIGQPELNEDRRGGDRYREDWELAHGPRGPNLVLIYSFNHWMSGSQIEPAAPDNPERADFPYLTYEPLGPEDYLFLTAELVDAFGYR
jgi:actin-like ATPase involved in cell morphogenesis